MESNVFHDSQPANLINTENADTKYGQDQAETHMVKLVDGKLVPTADVQTEISDDLTSQYANDEERGLYSANQRTHDIVDIQSAHPQADMVPGLPSTPDPSNPVPAGPDTPTPPTPPVPGPEIPDMPTTPKPDKPEITEPNEPGRSHEINNQITNDTDQQNTPTSALADFMPGADVPTQTQDPAKNEELPEFLGTSSANDGPGPANYRKPNADEGMETGPDTGTSARPYDVDAKDTHDYQPSERPQETAQMLDQPTETLDESSIKKAPMQDHSTAQAPSDMKSTDQLDRNYNDPEAARQDVI
ncbi:hypothetical protein LX87_03945 [Larkinella arboricola]|uniref:Uncharacterized protein n=1 Tax=Larkinella arboricola TaxID=643671 RepID=A0A327WSQ6_LARAB|nr:hypothetical protein [Larkinella arboricola]RAJ94061.1 hypothetical protein LX87_03945 [Larkinella arboricola]